MFASHALLVYTVFAKVATPTRTPPPRSSCRPLKILRWHCAMARWRDRGYLICNRTYVNLVYTEAGSLPPAGGGSRNRARKILRAFMQFKLDSLFQDELSVLFFCSKAESCLQGLRRLTFRPCTRDPKRGMLTVP